MQNPRNRVLVLGESSRATLAVIRSLGRHGIEVHLGTSDPTAPSARSRYVRRVVELPNELNDTSAWVEAIMQAARTYGYDLIVPTTGATATPLNANRDRLEPEVLLALSSKESISIAENKGRTMELAAKLGVPIPHSTFVRNNEELDAALTQTKTPIVIKPSVSYVLHNGRWKQLSVRVAEHTEEALLAARERLLYAPVLLQEYVEGIGVGQEFLCRNGEIVYAFQHNRVHEYRGSGGSTLRVSAPLDSEMLDSSKRLITALKWDGVLMIEYRWDERTKRFALMELNGRFWGSLALPLSAGVDFPYGLYAQKVLGNAPPITAYQTGKKARSIFEDIGQFFGSGGSVAGSILAYTAASMRLALGMEKWDQFALDDMSPFFAEMRRKLFKRRQVSNASGASRGRLFASLPNARRILFVCYGNINRSAFAECYARMRAAGKAEFRSAGEYPEEGRPASVNAQLAAKRFGVPLGEHRSSVLSSEHISWADLVLVMDGKNEWFVVGTFPDAKEKTFRLGMLDGGSSEIRDPYGLPVAAFEKTFARIARAVDALVQRLA